jgi:hypothetical protein
MLPTSTQRILETVGENGKLLDIGGWAAPFNRADYVLDAMPYETRGAMGHYGDQPERFTEDTWVVHDFCSREPWPFEDNFFDFAMCVTTLEDIRDPIWVAQEMSRVAKAGYVEVPTVKAELMWGVAGPYLGHYHHRWFCFPSGAGIEFLHKAHGIHSDWRLAVIPRWYANWELEDELEAIFWQDELRASERLCIDSYPYDELAAMVQNDVCPSPLDWKRRELTQRAGARRQRVLGAAKQRLVRGLSVLGRARPSRRSLPPAPGAYPDPRATP